MLKLAKIGKAARKLLALMKMLYPKRKDRKKLTPRHIVPTWVQNSFCAVQVNHEVLGIGVIGGQTVVVQNIHKQ